ncbi:unnamed protein product, partial [Pylaiella littoralis]
MALSVPEGEFVFSGKGFSESEIDFSGAGSWGSEGGMGDIALTTQQDNGITPPPTLWFADSGASKKSMTSGSSLMYNMREPPPGSSRIVTAGGTTLRVVACGDLDLIMHARTDFLVRMTSVLLVEDLSFDLLSLHWGQRNGRIVL